MKFCKNCSASLEDDAVFCTECGASLADDEFSSSVNLNSQNDNSEGFQGSTPSGGSSSNDYTSGSNYSSNNNHANNTNYNQPYQQYSAPQGSNPGVPWLIVNIVTFMFCCNILGGLVGLIFSIISMTSFNAGNLQEARNNAKVAKIVTIISIILTVLFWVLFLASGFWLALKEGYSSAYNYY